MRITCNLSAQHQRSTTDRADKTMSNRPTPPNYSSSSLFDISNLVAVITGGGSGLGLIVAHALAANNAKAVYILGRREDSLKACVTNAASNGDRIHPIVCDVTSKDSLNAAAARVRAEVGYIDVLFANSGVIHANTSVLGPGKNPSIKELQSGLFEPSMEDFTKTLHVNVTGTFYTVLAFLDLLDEGNKRAVVPQKSNVLITTSVAGYSRSPAAGFSYGASKAAAAHMAKQLATMLAPHKIRVNTIAPGFYPSEMTNKMPWMQGVNPRDEGSVDVAIVPLERTGSEEDMAGAALFLMSKAGGYIDGNVLLTDGGRLSTMPATY